MIYCQKIKDFDEVKRFVACTLLSVQQSEQDVRTWTLEALTFLQQYQFLLQYKNESFNTTSLVSDKASDLPLSSPSSSFSEEHRAQGGAAGGAHAMALLAASPLGRATTLSGIPPKDAVLVRGYLCGNKLYYYLFLCSVYMLCPHPRSDS
jgi:hypothetical protein